MNSYLPFGRPTIDEQTIAEVSEVLRSGWTFDHADEGHLIESERFHGIERDAEGNVDVLRASGKYNLSDVSARMGLAQLERLDAFSQRRRELATIYFEELAADPPGVLPAPGGGRETVTLPLFPAITDGDVRRVCSSLRHVLANRS